MSATVGISIVNYKTARLVIDCLISLEAEQSATLPLQVIVVDNDSRDGSFETLIQFITEREWQSWIEIIAAEKNGGYSYGNNIAIKKLMATDCKCIWLLNPDTQILPGAARELINALESHPDTGIAGSRLEDPDGTPQISAFNFPTPSGEFINTANIGIIDKLFPRLLIRKPIATHIEPADWVAGASMMLKAELIKKIGPMDEHYFLYYEEVDYCQEAQRAGFGVLYVPTSRVIHQVGAATGISDHRKTAPRRPAYWFESRQRFFRKQYGVCGLLIADIAWITAFGLSKTKAQLRREKLNMPPHFFKDFMKNSLLCKWTLLK
ncbi:MAG: glycosyltransferase family 2 protein [Spongiibacteraceae bacterium]